MRRYSEVRACVLAGAASLAAAAPGLAAEPHFSKKSVLLPFGERADVPAMRSVEAGLREPFVKQEDVDVFAEYLDFARFPAEQCEADLVARVLNTKSL